MPMEEQEAVSIGFLSIPRSDSKIVGEKRRSEESEERLDISQKMRCLDSVLESETTAHDSKNIRNKESDEQLKLRNEEMSQVTEVSLTLGTVALETRNKNIEVKHSLKQLDLNTDACLANDSAPNDSEKQSFSGKHDNSRVTHKGIQLDLNADAVSSSVNDDSLFCSSKRCNNSKSRDGLSECGISTNLIEEKDPMKLWKEMKQNGFLSCPHGGISAASSCVVSSSHGGILVPRKRGRKSKTDSMKKKIEIAKREEVNRFTKIAAPSGLLNDLNPGIINHVRNKKQVLSIIQNLVRSEKDSGNFHKTQKKSGSDVGGSRKNPEDVNNDASLSDCNRTFTYFMPMNKCLMKTYDEKCGDGDLSIVDTISEEDEESANFSSASVLTVKAATVASEWLELLRQDIKGRLSALRRSKKRVRAVTTSELPFLILKEFPSNQENDPSAVMKDGLSKTAIADMHRERWTMLFNQMDQTLSEEERQLESWLNQVKELQLHCDQGLQQLSLNSGHSLLQLGIPDGNLRPGKALSTENELAVRAAAASIYSTCNFLSSKENVTCS